MLAVFLKILFFSLPRNSSFFHAGFMGKSKPNMWSQETQSIACVLRILFKMYADERFSQSWPVVEEKLIRSVLF